MKGRTCTCKADELDDAREAALVCVDILDRRAGYVVTSLDVAPDEVGADYMELCVRLKRLGNALDALERIEVSA